MSARPREQTLARSAHPAVDAWRRVTTCRQTPLAVEQLKRSRKSTVYRLVGVGEGRSNVIAKRCLDETAAIERVVYEEILPDVEVSGLRCYGFAPDEEGWCWLFLEDAGETAYSWDRQEHRALAARWLATLHLGAAGLSALTRLPERGARDYLGHLRNARAVINGNLANSALSRANVSLLCALIELCNFLEESWNQLDDFCSQFTKTLVHGDFKPKNVRIRSGPASSAIVPLDWEMAGRGVPAVDIRRVDHPVYASAVRSVWPKLAAETPGRFLAAGQIFWCLAAIDWCARSLQYESIADAMSHMEIYAERLPRFVRSFLVTA